MELATQACPKKAPHEQVQETCLLAVRLAVRAAVQRRAVQYTGEKRYLQADMLAGSVATRQSSRVNPGQESWKTEGKER